MSSDSIPRRILRHQPKWKKKVCEDLRKDGRMRCCNIVTGLNSGKKKNFFSHCNAGGMGSNLRHGCMSEFFPFLMLSCVSSGLVTGWSPSREFYQLSVSFITSDQFWMETGQGGLIHERMKTNSDSYHCLLRNSRGGPGPCGLIVEGGLNSIITEEHSTDPRPET
jgi:hypothetical protein